MKWLGALLVVIILLSAWFWISTQPKTTTTKTDIRTSDGNVTSVEVTKTDIAGGSTSNLPAGFPNNIPVETNNLTESFRAAYKSRNIVQYSVSYTSARSRDALWDTYSEFFNSSGYTVDKTGTSRSLGQLSAALDNDSISVVISGHNGLSLVQINYVER